MPRSIPPKYLPQENNMLLSYNVIFVRTDKKSWINCQKLSNSTVLLAPGEALFSSRPILVISCAKMYSIASKMIFKNTS